MRRGELGGGLASACLVAAACAGPSDRAAPTSGPWPFQPERDRMVDVIERYAAVSDAPGVPEAFDEDVLAAMRTVPRHAFVPEALIPFAYADRPLPIGLDQTISQPFIVAWMTQLSGAGPGARVLEVGTGSGYQAAVLAELGAEVYTIEILPELARQAAEQLEAAGYGDVAVRAGDGYRGWPEAAPFDAVLVTAAAPDIPAPLVEQLALGGRLVIPVGPADSAQRLTMVAKDPDGDLAVLELPRVRFVPLTRSPEP